MSRFRSGRPSVPQCHSYWHSAESLGLVCWRLREPELSLYTFWYRQQDNRHINAKLSHLSDHVIHPIAGNRTKQTTLSTKTNMQKLMKMSYRVSISLLRKARQEPDKRPSCLLELSQFYSATSCSATLQPPAVCCSPPESRHISHWSGALFPAWTPIWLQNEHRWN